MFVTTVTYPGIVQIESATATINHGITPAAITVRIAPQDVTAIALNGDFSINYSGKSTSVSVTFSDCNADSASYVFNASGQIISLIIRDFRWQWQFGAISGRYNIRGSDGEIPVTVVNGTPVTDAIGNSEKTPQELCELLLDAMGVTTYDVADVPNDPRPTCRWDFANPAQELDRILKPLNCDIVPALDGSVSIRKRGVGATLPAGPVESTSGSLNPVDQPEKIVLITAPLKLQLDFELEAVGEETDGTLKPIDNLSYKPSGMTGSWGVAEHISFDHLDEQKRKLAESSVLKQFRIKIPSSLSGLAATPGYGSLSTPDYIEQFLPLDDNLVETIDIQTGSGATLTTVSKPRDPFVYGKWFHSYLGSSKNSIDDMTNIDAENVEASHANTMLYGDDLDFPWRLDKENGIVEFANPIRSVDETSGFVVLPNLRLRTSCFVRFTSDGGLARYGSERTINASSPSPDRHIIRNDIQPLYILKATIGTENFAETKSKANEYLDEIESEYDTVAPLNQTYGGLLNIALDGPIRSVSWRVDQSGTSTQAYWNDDQGDTYTPTREQRKRRQEINRLVSQSENLS